MLYDPKWEVKVDPLSIEAVIAWLETKPADETYCYTDSGRCLAAQYNESIGRKYHLRRIPGHDWVRPRTFDQQLEKIAVLGDPTFGAALKRARAWLASVNQ